MTPRDPEAGQGPLHAATLFLEGRLRAVFPPERFQHETLPAPLDEKLLGKLSSHRAPFVGLAFLGITAADNSGRALRGTMRFGLYLLTKNPKPRARTLGDNVAPGLMQMLHAAVVGLHGWVAGGERHGGSGVLEVRSAEQVDGSAWQDNDAACGVVALELPALWTATVPDELRRLASSWSFGGAETAATDAWERPA